MFKKIMLVSMLVLASGAAMAKAPDGWLEFQPLSCEGEGASRCPIILGMGEITAERLQQAWSARFPGSAMPKLTAAHQTQMAKLSKANQQAAGRFGGTPVVMVNYWQKDGVSYIALNYVLQRPDNWLLQLNGRGTLKLTR